MTVPIEMAKQTNSFELALPRRITGTPAYRWLYSALREEILRGRLHPGTRLPATRDLSRQYRLARGTIVTAFEQLESEGYLKGRVGSGTYVSQQLPDELFAVRLAGGLKSGPPKPPRPTSNFASRVRMFPGFDSHPTRAFRPNLPALDLFPMSLWTKVAARRLRCVSTNLLMGCDPMGYGPLQVIVADYLSKSRGVDCVPEQIAIVSGVQEALDLVARLLLNPGDKVCVEKPGYVGATLVFEALGAKVVGLPVDEEGMTLPAEDLIGARLGYVTPGHQFPLGVTMSLPRRFELLGWARRSGALIFEDDYDSEYRYSGSPVPALQGLDPHGLVFFFGSFSKVLFPSLRLGYLVVPSSLVDLFTAARSITTRHAPVLDQAVLHDFIAEGHFGRHLRRMREVYSKRLSVLLESARGVLEISSVEAGLQTVAWLPKGFHARSVARTARLRNVVVTPLVQHRNGRLREGLTLGFAAVDAREIRRGMRELKEILEAKS